VVLVNVNKTAKMPSIDPSTRDKICKYVQGCTGPGKNWEDNADSICHLIENGKLIGEKDIVYDNGKIIKIKGTEVVDGVLLLKEKKKPLKVTAMPNNAPIPFIDELRARRRIILL
jgi:hypothetical protein